MNTLREFVEYKLTHSDKLAEAKGYPLVMENCKKNKKMKQLELYGNSIQEGENLFDPSIARTAGYYIDMNGNEVAQGGWSITSYIEVNGYDFTLTNVGGGAPAVCAYDENQTFITGVRYATNGANDKKAINIKSTTLIKYIRFSIANDWVSNLSIYDIKLFNSITPDAPIDIESIGEKSINLFNPHIDEDLSAWYRIGLEKTFNDDDSFNLSATSLRQNYCYMGGQASYAANQEYFIPQGETVTTIGTWDCIDDTVCIGVCLYGADKVLVKQFNSLQNGVIGKWTVTKDVYYISYVIRLPNHVAGDALDINNIKLQLQYGNTATEYEPYGKYKIPVVSRGKNYFSMEKAKLPQKTINGITMTPLDDERIHIKGKAIDSSIQTSFRWDHSRVPIPSGQYVCKGVFNFNTFFGVGVASSWVVNMNAKLVTTVPDNAYIYYTCLFIPENTTQEFDDIIELQIEKGTSLADRSSYEPYVEPATTNVWLDEPLRKIGDNFDALDLRSKQVSRYIKEVVLDGVSNGKRITSFTKHSTGLYYGICGGLSAMANGAANVVKNSHFKAVQSVAKGNCYITAGATGCLMVHTNQEIDEQNKWNEWLQEQYNNGTPVTINYARSTPIEEPLEVELPKLNAKTSVIEVNTGIQASNAYGKYIKR